MLVEGSGVPFLGKLFEIVLCHFLVQVLSTFAPIARPVNGDISVSLGGEENSQSVWRNHGDDFEVKLLTWHGKARREIRFVSRSSGQ